MCLGATLTPPLWAQDRFSLEVDAPEALRSFLLRHLELQRYRQLEDLDPAELARLVAQAPANVRDLLATQGHFSPEVTVAQPTAAAPGALPQVQIRVLPGPITTVRGVDIAVTDEGADARQRERVVREGWSLTEGQTFTQSGWDRAKSEALRQLNAYRYPNAQLAESRADIEPEARVARLRLRYALGAPVTLGAIEVQGSERYDPEIARRIARLAGVTPGTDYDLASLQTAQRRLAESGYYDSAFLFVDSSARSDRAPVVLQVREARLQKLVLGAGVSTDSGPRLSLEHTHHRVPGLDWRAKTRLLLERNTPLAETEWSSPIDDKGWQWIASGLAQRQNDTGQATTSQRLRAGLSQDGERLDRSFYLQFDRARTERDPFESSLSLNYAWTRNAFDDPLFPKRGYGLAVELGVGTTLSAGQRSPYGRTRVRWQGVWPAPTQTGRLVLRLEGGAVVARDSAPVPATQRFLTGGDTTVRGYGLRDIGVPQADGTVAAGRYLGVASIEWQRPLAWGAPGEWEHTVFVDAGGVADRPGNIRPRVGVGTGVRYNSPVGPLQMDVAYGVDARRLRLHLSIGFQF